jgi:hypothetical protein
VITLNTSSTLYVKYSFLLPSVRICVFCTLLTARRFYSLSMWSGLNVNVNYGLNFYMIFEMNFNSELEIQIWLRHEYFCRPKYWIPYSENFRFTEILKEKQDMSVWTILTCFRVRASGRPSCTRLYTLMFYLCRFSEQILASTDRVEWGGRFIVEYSLQNLYL